MAVTGGATTAYRCWVQDSILCVSGSLMVGRKSCLSVEDALLPLSRGEIVTVAGSDMVVLRSALKEKGVLT